ncbi:OmpA family protein [Haematospirillum jordaniae]|uniref:OmpA family protein n=1 Tax=Haematospirillum jordaniae TaxID=1549855 RepID=UPI001432F573|nr:OmpA family protein [Haematospirillum jordaniae]NKD84674.1 OmpA family protein [Haematospirillum jordaniae]
MKRAITFSPLPLLRLSLAASLPVLLSLSAHAGATDASSRPAVFVDLKALDALGPPHTISDTSSLATEPARKVRRNLPSRLHVPPPVHDNLPTQPEQPLAEKKAGGEKAPETKKGHHTATPSLPAFLQAVTPPARIEKRDVSPASLKTSKEPSVKVTEPGTDPLAFAPAALSLAFEPDEITLPEAAKTHLDTLARDMRKKKKTSAQLMAYARKDPHNPSRARRTSLARALAIRSYLLEKGIPSNRIGVRALGGQAPDGREDRVDILLAGS